MAKENKREMKFVDDTDLLELLDCRIKWIWQPKFNRIPQHLLNASQTIQILTFYSS